MTLNWTKINQNVIEGESDSSKKNWIQTSASVNQIRWFLLKSIEKKWSKLLRRHFFLTPRVGKKKQTWPKATKRKIENFKGIKAYTYHKIE